MPLYFEIFRQSGFGFVDVFQQMASGNTLLRNRGDGTFEDVTWKAGANPLGWFWGSSFADFDNDGWQDIYSANGWVYNDRGTEIELEFLNNVVEQPGRVQDRHSSSIRSTSARRSWHGWERNRHLRNNGDGTFREMGRAGRHRPAAEQPRRRAWPTSGTAASRHRRRGVDRPPRAAAQRRRPRRATGWGSSWSARRSNRDAVGARVTRSVGGLAADARSGARRRLRLAEHAAAALRPRRRDERSTS